ncbi:MAG: hypothetical protein ACRDH9_03640 [Actinomycetota bacterium]
MTEPESSENGYARARPRLPLWITIVSIVLAIGSVSVLVLFLYEETKGPAEILREFARRVDRGDCPGSYDLLNEQLRGAYTEDVWCEQVPSIDAAIDADFALEEAVLGGDRANVVIDGDDANTWFLTRHGERSWRVAGAADGVFDVPAS